MSGADAVLAHGLLNVMAAISATASTLRRVPQHRHEKFCTILERQLELAEAFLYGMTKSARDTLETPLWRVSSLTARAVELARRDTGMPSDAQLSALHEACETAALAIRGFVHGFSPEVVVALEGLGEHRRDATEEGPSTAPG